MVDVVATPILSRESADDEFKPTTLEEKAKREDSVSPEPRHERITVEKSRPIVFKEKEFKIRPSVLTTLLDGSAGVVFNVFVAFFVLLTMATMIKDTVEQRNPFSHFWLILWNFRALPQTLFIWGLMFLSTLIFPYAAFKMWAHIPSKSVTLRSELPYLAAYVGYLASLFYFPLKFLFYMNLNPACSFIITCENTRMAMKVHAFVRENANRGIQRKLKQEKLKIGEVSQDWPSVEQFVYYMFCPSFIYRDSYPRAATRDWGVVLKYFAQCLACIYHTNLVFIQFVEPYFSALDYKGISWMDVVYSFFPSILPGMYCLLMLFYGLLHCWLNMFSEAMQFGDRLFYVNWWNSKNMAEYYRNWNLVVHEWLYAYVYRDLATLIGGKKGLKIAQTVVFFLSAAFHEYWFGVSLRVFYPIMFGLYFIFGGIFYSVSRVIRMDYIWNILLFFNLLLGTGMFISCYSLEWYARQRCGPTVDNAILDVLIPRHWFCY
ncbi:hypothetical protein QR680_019188 [Steinernema hermaphroditum]|uniref:O-acyltransferase n=1 Tax=Steinernema hermaphroditum TaxID=289476 RepID=A0AA39LS95_9BILA|nr:hypothetical protein QR680_019188 [Steinernema hermaphroditum]